MKKLEFKVDKCGDIYLPIRIEVIVSYGFFIELTNFNSIKIFWKFGKEILHLKRKTVCADSDR